MSTNPDVKTKLAFLVTAFVVVPVLLGGAVYLGLLLQPSGTWKRLMPAAVFQKPARGLRVLVLTKDYEEGAWLPLYESHYTYPSGKRSWLVLKEKIDLTPRAESPLSGGVWSDAFAVDPAGAFSRFRLKGATTPEFEPAAGVPKDVSDLLANGLIVCEDRATLRAMRQRIPALRQREDVLFFAEAFPDPGKAASSRYGTRLNAGALPRIAAFIGVFLAAAATFSLLAGAPGYYRAALALLSIPATALILVGTVLGVGSLVPGAFFVLPYALWLLFAGVAGRIILARPGTPLGSLGLDGVVGRLKRQPLRALLVGAIVSVIALYFGFFYPAEHLTYGDSVRWVRGAMYVYDHGRWPLDRVVADLGRDSMLAAYPPGVSVLMAYSAWAVGPDPARLFFPGDQTGAVWLLYAVFLFLLHVALVGAVVFTAKALVPGERSVWMLAALFVLVFVPSARGWLHAGESLLWPLFGAGLVAAMIWRRAGSLLAACLTLLLMIGLTWIKSEGLPLSVVLIGPWVALCAPVVARWLRRAPRSAALLCLVALCALVPAAVLAAQKASLGVARPGYHPFSLSVLLSEPGTYLRSVKAVLRTPFWWSEEPALTKLAALPIVILFLMLAYLQITDFSWRRFIVPLGIGAFCLGMPALFVFSTAPVIEWHIDNSWYRLFVPVVMTAGMFLLDMVADYVGKGAPRVAALPPAREARELVRS